MRPERLSDLMREQQLNLSALQEWMRAAGVDSVGVSLSPVTLMGSHKFRLRQGVSGVVINDRIRQILHDDQYEHNGVQEVPAIEAVREIIRFSLTSDSLVHNLAVSSGAEITIPSEGPLELSCEAIEVRVPPHMVH